MDTEYRIVCEFHGTPASDGAAARIVAEAGAERGLKLYGQRVLPSGAVSAYVDGGPDVADVIVRWSRDRKAPVRLVLGQDIIQGGTVNPNGRPGEAFASGAFTDAAARTAADPDAIGWTGAGPTL